jgi:hypothetical protein
VRPANYKSVAISIYNLTMSSLDAWAIKLECPHCGRIGTATVSDGVYTRRMSWLDAVWMFAGVLVLGAAGAAAFVLATRVLSLLLSP